MAHIAVVEQFNFSEHVCCFFDAFCFWIKYPFTMYLCMGINGVME